MKATALLGLFIVGLAQAALYDGVINSTAGTTITYHDIAVSTTAADTSGAVANNAGSALILTNVNVTTSGESSSADDSNFYGLNAGVLAANGASVVMENVRIVTSGKGANGAFAYNSGSNITMRNSIIICTGTLGHGVDSTYEGYVYIENVNITTTGSHGAPLSNDRGGGTVVAHGGYMHSTGSGSPGIYCTGVVNVTGAHIVSVNTEAVTIEGRNQVHLWDTYLESDHCQGAKIYCSTSGDATAGHSKFSITGGQFVLATANATACESSGNALFLVDGTNDQESTITMTGTTVTSSATTLLYVVNSAVCNFNAVSQPLVGNIIASSGTVTSDLTSSSSLYGHVTGSSVSIDSTSSWTNTRASTVTTLDALGTLKIRSSEATITASGAATISGTLILGSAFTNGTYTIISAANVSGSFTSVTCETSTLSAVATTVGGNITVTITGTGGGQESSLIADDTLPDLETSTATGGDAGGGTGGMGSMPGGMGSMPGGMGSDATGGASETDVASTPAAAQSASTGTTPAQQQSSAGTTTDKQSSAGTATDKQSSAGTTTDKQSSAGTTADKQSSAGTTTDKQSSAGQQTSADASPAAAAESSTGKVNGCQVIGFSTTLLFAAVALAL